LAAVTSPVKKWRVDWKNSAPFLIFHLIPLAAIFTGVDRRAVVLCVALYAIRMFAITAGYHRYFAHRSYRLARVPQFILAFLGLTATQKGPLWWAANHRVHHKYTDTDRDPHSPRRGFWWSHWGWILSCENTETDFEGIQDFARFPELRFLNRNDWLGPWTAGVVCFLIGGWSGLVVGFFWSTVLLWHATFCVNSWAHVMGRRRYGTPDTSRNSVFVALITGGEGWHNNHHHYPASTRQGFYWWEIDATYYVLRALSVVRVVQDMRQPPPAAKVARRVRSGHLDLGMLRLHLRRAAATATAADQELAAMIETVSERAADVAKSSRIPVGAAKGDAAPD
jgi:stearoyl-CoA desaturase (delta-9 desaturase)